MPIFETEEERETFRVCVEFLEARREKEGHMCLLEPFEKIE